MSELNKTIIHIDMNSYFATVEQQADPCLRGKPVGVLKAQGRNCIIAVSKEAKLYGVATGSNTWEALRLCPGIILVPSDMDKYFAVTKKLIEIVKCYSPLIEVFSIDEMFLDVTSTQELFEGGATGVAVAIKERIKDEIGEWLTCSVGISYNKILAKLASEQMKPDGLFVLDRENLDKVLARIKPSCVCGIGYRMERKLQKLGITNLLQLRTLPYEYLLAQFGEHWARFLLATALGEGTDILNNMENIPEQKSVSRTFTTFRNLESKDQVKALVRNLSEEVAWKLRKMGMTGRCVGISVRGGGVSVFERRTTREEVDDGALIFDMAWGLFEGLEWRSSVRFAGVWMTNLRSSRLNSQSLIPEIKKKESINRAMDQVNNRYGYFSLYPGRLLGAETARPEPNGFLGDKKFLFG